MRTKRLPPHTQGHSNSNAILYFCHIVNSFTISIYKKLAHEIGSDYTLFWVFQEDNTYRETTLLLEKGINVFSFRLSDLNSLGYKQIQDLYGNDHYMYCYFFMENPQFKFYWIIEYDVLYSGNWENLFGYFKNDDADFISSHIERRNINNEEWCWWNSMHSNSMHPTHTNTQIKSFNPICRLSNSAMFFLDRLLTNKENYGFCEVFIATAMHWRQLKIEDFGGIGEFVTTVNKNKFYVQGVGVNNGTIRWRPVFSHEEIQALGITNKLFHPVKQSQSSNPDVQDATILRTPVVYVATYGTGNTDYPAFLYISLFSVLRLHHASVTIITDEHTQFVPFITQHATIKRVSMPQSLTTKQKSRFLKTQVGNLINGRFLYLDCDTILVRPIKEIDTCDCDIACAIEYNSPFVHDNGYIDSNTRETERTNRNFYYNSGVILSCGSYASKCFFTSWHKNWIKYAKKLVKILTSHRFTPQT